MNPFLQILEHIKSIWSRLTMTQRLVIIGVVTGAVVIMASVVHFAGRPEYVTLFSGLPEEESGKVVEYLEEQGVNYILENGGHTIKVQRQDMYKSRIQLAQEGIPSDGITGYEIFDQTNLGMSEFVQKLNFRRALEGELGRTIESLSEVDKARVHIVIPEAALFREEQEPTTASVALRLRTHIDQSQVNGIAHLVASSVQGLDVENITIIDGKGNVLSNLQSRDEVMAMTASQLQLKHTVEENLGKKVETMLDGLLGKDKAIVRVAVDLDMSRQEINSESFDPDRVAIRSEESVEVQSNTTEQRTFNPADPNLAPLGANSNSTENSVITNYEVSRTQSHTVKNGGGIHRISASVLVDGTYAVVTDADGNSVEEYRPRTTEEMQRISQAVRTALGMDETRGDELSVENIQFQMDEREFEEGGILEWLKENWYDLVRNLVLAIAVLGALFYVTNLLKRSSKAAAAMYERQLAAIPETSGRLALPEVEGVRAQRLALPDIEDDLPPEVVEANQLQQQLVDFVNEKPDVAARLIKTWLIN